MYLQHGTSRYTRGQQHTPRCNQVQQGSPRYTKIHLGVAKCKKVHPGTSRYTQVQTVVECFTRAAEFGCGGHPCQGLVPPQATWPSSSGPADTVRPEFAANTALMYASAADQPGATDRRQQQPAAAQAACSSSTAPPSTCSHPDSCPAAAAAAAESRPNTISCF